MDDEGGRGREVLYKGGQLRLAHLLLTSEIFGAPSMRTAVDQWEESRTNGGQL